MPLTLSGDGSIGPLSATEVGYLDGVTSAVQTQINGKLTTPVWTSYTPTVSSAAGTITSYTVNSAAYLQIGKMVNVRFNFTLNNAGTGSSVLYVSLPVNAIGFSQYGGTARECATTGFLCSVGINAAANLTRLEILKYDNTSIITTGYLIIGSLTYEAA